MEDICKECQNASYDCYEYYGGHKQWFMDGCKEGLEPYYDKEEECTTCEKFKRRLDDV